MENNIRADLDVRQAVETGALLRRGSLDAPDVADDGGSIEGCGNVTGYMDCYGTITAQGSMKKCLPDLLKQGFMPDDHGAAFGYRYPNAAVVGYFDKLVEDDMGLQIKAVFHKTPDAQSLRTKFKERHEAGKDCGFSIGFRVGDGKNMPQEGKDYITLNPVTMAEDLKRWSKKEYYVDNLARATNMVEAGWPIRILLRVTIFEISPTLMPANEVSLVTDVRSGTTNNNRAMAKTKKDPELESKLDALDECHGKLSAAMKAHADCHDDVMDAVGVMGKKSRALKDSHREFKKAYDAVKSHIDGKVIVPEKKDDEEADSKKDGDGDTDSKKLSNDLDALSPEQRSAVAELIRATIAGGKD